MTPSNNLKLAVLIAFAIGGWAVTLGSWTTASSPAAVGGLLLILSTTVGAAYGIKTGGVK